MNKNILLASAALSVVPTLVAAKAPGKRVQPKQPNIIFILCDDMGYGDPEDLQSHFMLSV